MGYVILSPERASRVYSLMYMPPALKIIVSPTQLIWEEHRQATQTHSQSHHETILRRAESVSAR